MSLVWCPSCRKNVDELVAVRGGRHRVCVGCSALIYPPRTCKDCVWVGTNGEDCEWHMKNLPASLIGIIAGPVKFTGDAETCSQFETPVQRSWKDQMRWEQSYK